MTFGFRLADIAEAVAASALRADTSTGMSIPATARPAAIMISFMVAMVSSSSDSGAMIQNASCAGAAIRMPAS